MSIFAFDIREAVLLTRDIYFVFGLKKYKKGQDLLEQITNIESVRKYGEGLQKTCQFLVNEYPKYKQAPIWGLKYCEGNEYQNDKEKQAFRETIDYIIEIASSGYRGENVHKVNLLLELYKYDFTYICRCERKNYLLEGFYNYILSDMEAHINEEELKETITFIEEHVGRSIYLLTEEMVTDGVRKYRQSFPILTLPPCK